MTKSPRRLPDRWARGPGGQPDAHDYGATPRAGGRPRRAGGDRPAGPRGRTPRGAPSPTTAAEAPLVPDRGAASPPLATPCTRMHLPRIKPYRGRQFGGPVGQEPEQCPPPSPRGSVDMLELPGGRTRCALIPITLIIRPPRTAPPTWPAIPRRPPRSRRTRGPPGWRTWT